MFCIDQAKRSCYRAANSIFARVGRLASEEVMVQLLKYKCLPILLYPSEVCNLIKGYCSRLAFFTKLFKTSNIEIVHYCQTTFGCELHSVLLVKFLLLRTTTVYRPLSGAIPGRAGTEETFTHSPVLVINPPLSASSIYYDPSFLFNLRTWRSFCTTSVHVLFGRSTLVWSPAPHIPYFSSPN